MIEAALLLLELILIGLLLWNVSSNSDAAQVKSLGLFSYRDLPTAPPKGKGPKRA